MCYNRDVMKKSKQIVVNLAILLALLVGVGFLFVYSSQAMAGETNTASVDDLDKQIDEINEQINAKQQTMDELDQKIKLYEDNIRKKQDESLSLKSQIEVIQENISKKQADIESSENEIDILTLELEALELKMQETGEQITREKIQLNNFLKEMYLYSNKTYLEIALNYTSFSDYFREVRYLEGAQTNVQDVLYEIMTLQAVLEDKQAETSDKKQELEDRKQSLFAEKQGLEGEQTYVNQTLADLSQDEEKFQELVSAVQKEIQAANSSIVSLEKQLRATLDEKNKAQGNTPTNSNTNTQTNNPPLVLEGPFNPSWPNSYRLITAYFHDTDYPFRRWFEHSAIDIAMPQGTTLNAVAPGYVAIAKDAGLGYSYIMIIHSDGYATVFGHVSAIYVRPDQYVNRGEVVGLSGGMPGTSGAGSFTTGPHLHFEVRLNGIPVNPLNYLP